VVKKARNNEMKSNYRKSYIPNTTSVVRTGSNSLLYWFDID